MADKDISDYKKKYHSVRHHAWAGSVLLAILLAVRIFLETSDIYFEHMDTLILIIGAFIVVYTLTALFFTYKYRSGVSSDEKIILTSTPSNDLEKDKLRAEVEKERLKVEKKKAKAEAKKAKKAK